MINKVADRITDPEAIRQSCIHPIDILKASMTFAQGHGMRGSGEWEAVPQVTDALSNAFQLAYGNVEKTGKRYLLAIDGSGSMYSPVNGLEYLMCADTAAAMALILANTEPNYTIVKFTTRASIYNKITPGMSLDSALNRWRIDATPEGTDCASPILLALERKIPVDVFVLLTDNQTWAGYVHPVQALQDYRDKMGIPARYVVAAMADSHVSTADQSDPLSLDIAGFDTSMPALIAEFAKGTI